ncbi:MAG: aminoglycoside phosphotransferase family protein [Planctomycetota bacterium]
MEPWNSDHDLTREQLAAALARAIESREYVGEVDFDGRPRPVWFAEGWDCDVFRVCDARGCTWLCKLPKRGGVQPHLRREALLLDDLRRVAAGLVPRIGMRGPSGTLPYEWIALSLAPGQPVFPLLRSIDPGSFGRSYGARLSELHRWHPEPIGPRPTSTVHSFGRLINDARTAADSLRPHVSRDGMRRIENMLTRAADYPEVELPATFVHGDLFPEHVYVDPETCQVIHLIDWADAKWGDPAVDFALLGWLLGDDFLRAATEAYGGEDTDSLRLRAAQLGMLFGMCDVPVAERGAPNVPLAERVAVLQRRVAGGWLERI